MEAMDMKKMIEMKEKAYLELLEEKSKIEATQKDLQEIIEKVEKLEKVCGDEGLDEDLERKKRAIKQLKELAISFDKVNQELSGYEENHIKEQIEFLHDNQKLHQLRSDLKEIEYMSNDLVKKHGLTNTVEVTNFEGKKKRVHADFVEEYEMYVRKIKEIAGHKLLNDYARIEGYAFAPIKSNVPTNEAQKKLLTDADNIELHEKEEDTLSVDERIRNTEIRIQEIINSRYLPKHGKISVVTYNGKKIEIPRSQRGNFAKLIGDLRKYDKEKSELLSKKVDEKKYELIIPEEVEPVVKEEEQKIEAEVVPINEIKNNDKEEMRRAIERAATKIAVAVVVSMIINSKNYKLKNTFTNQTSYEQIIDMSKEEKKQEEVKESKEKKEEKPKENKKELEEAKENKKELEEAKEKERQERLRKMAQLYTMPGAKLDAIEQNGYYVQGGRKR